MKGLFIFILSVSFAIVLVSSNSRNLLHSLCKHECFLCCQGNLGVGYINKSHLTIKRQAFYAFY